MVYKHLIPVKNMKMFVHILNDTDFKVVFVMESFKCLQIIDLVFYCELLNKDVYPGVNSIKIPSMSFHSFKDYHWLILFNFRLLPWYYFKMKVLFFFFL